jgi:uncharacterized membrane protein YjgN (DUF898 family)
MSETIDVAPVERDDASDAPQFPPSPPPLPQRCEHAFEFSGDAAEYFRIWIVNLALTIVTLGVYSAWAKVRTQRYFYAHTRVADAPFEYLAEPLPILKGRAIAVTLFGAYLLAGQLHPFAQLGLGIVLAIVSPWLIVRGLMFRARYSAWRGITFRFIGDYGEAIKYFLLMMLLVPFTLGMIYPYIKARQKQFIVENHRFGTRWFTYSAQPSQFYPPYLLAMGLLFVWMFAVISGFVGVVMSSVESEADLDGGVIEYALPALIYVGYFFSFVYLAARITNLVYNHTEIDGHRLRSTVRARDLLGLYLSNTVAILASLGMLIPWAMVRMARYRAQHLVLIALGDLDRFSREARHDEGAAGAEMDALFDLDIGL